MPRPAAVLVAAALAAAALLSACRVAPAGGAADVANDSSAVAVPDVAVTPDGALFTTSVEGLGESRRLVVTRPDGASVEVARGGVSDHSQAAPRLVATGGGLLVLYAVEAAVEGRRFPASDLFLARSTDAGRTFGAPARVSPAGGPPTGHSFADVAATPAGDVVVSWLDQTKADAWTRSHPESVAARPAGGRAAVRLVHSGETHHGGAHHGESGPGSSLVVARSRDGGRTFGAPAEVAGGVCPCCRTALDVGPDGAVRVAWRHVWAGGERDPAVATSRDGGRTFGAPVRVHADRWAVDGCPHAGPAVATDAAGRVHVAWYTGAPGRTGLWRAVSADGGATFGEPAALGPERVLGQTRAARSGRGDVWIAWEDRLTDRVHLAPAFGGDTTTVSGVDPALTGTPTGWALAVINRGRVEVRTSAQRAR